MLGNWLNDYGPSNREALLALAAIGVLVAAGYWLLRRHGQRAARRLEADVAARQRQHEQLQAQLADAQRQNEELQAQLPAAQGQNAQMRAQLAAVQQQDEQLQAQLAEARRQHELATARYQSELAEIRAHSDPAQVKALQDHLQRVVAHEFVKGLHFISSLSEGAVARLHDDQPDVRDRLNEVRAKAHEMTRHARNVVELPDLERTALQREMVNLRGLLEGVLKELFPYAEARGVHLQVTYGSLGPLTTVRPLLHQACSNIIHNAIKFSPPGGVVEISLFLEEDGEKRAVVEVCDHGRGIAVEDRERIFELNVRGDGLVAPGSGLGLYYARRAARLLGGVVVLKESKVNEGSTFRIVLPYAEHGDAQ